MLTNQEVLDSLGKRSFLQEVIAWEVVDEYTVDIVTVAPNTELPGLHHRIGFAALPEQFIEENGIEALAEMPIGAGPCKFESWERGQSVVLSRAAALEGVELELVYGEGRIPEEDQLAEIYKASFEAIGLSVEVFDAVRDRLLAESDAAEVV